MRVLVTGGAGYIGSHTAKALAHAGFEPVVYDNLSTGHRWAVRWGPFREGDLEDGMALRLAIREFRPEAVIHFAASASVFASMEHPREYFRNNVGNTLNLLETMMEEGVGIFVFSSSCATYGVPEDTPIREETPQKPVNPYGESKLFVERVLHWYGCAYGLRWAALRYFNAAGADPEGEIGEEHSPETHLIPSVIEAALGRSPSVKLYGADYPTPDGTAIRDYIHVTDLADAHLRALRLLTGGVGSIALNLGTGAGYSVRQIIQAVERISGRAIEQRLCPRRAGDPATLVADPTRAEMMLYWKPRLSGLEAIVRSAWEWHSTHQNTCWLPPLTA